MACRLLPAAWLSVSKAKTDVAFLLLVEAELTPMETSLSLSHKCPPQLLPLNIWKWDKYLSPVFLQTARDISQVLWVTLLKPFSTDLKVRIKYPFPFLQRVWGKYLNSLKIWPLRNLLWEELWLLCSPSLEVDECHKTIVHHSCKSGICGLTLLWVV